MCAGAFKDLGRNQQSTQYFEETMSVPHSMPDPANARPIPCTTPIASFPIPLNHPKFFLKALLTNQKQPQ